VVRLYHKALLKKRAVDVLQAAFLLKNAKESDPNNRELILSRFIDFRSEMIAFKSIA
jgi:hypothetical protein